jgi:hypothetical protein
VASEDLDKTPSRALASAPALALVVQLLEEVGLVIHRRAAIFTHIPPVIHNLLVLPRLLGISAQDYAGASDVDPRRSLTTTGSRHHPADDSRRRATQ